MYLKELLCCFQALQTSHMHYASMMQSEEFIIVYSQGGENRGTQVKNFTTFEMQEIFGLPKTPYHTTVI